MATVCVCVVADPDADYKPPEYDKIGNSTKGHIYSLGMLISEASAYNSGTDTKIPQHSTRLRKLLSKYVKLSHICERHSETVIQ